MNIPDTSYVRSGEVAIAYQVFGAGEHDLLLTFSSAQNGQALWGVPEAVQVLERLGRFARVITYDRRDSGLSDPIRDDLTLEAHAEDALAVMDAVGARRPVLVGALDGARSLALLAATRPERVGGLVAFSPTPRGVAADNQEFAASAAQAIAEATDWPPASLVELYAPAWAADPVRLQTYRRYMRTTLTPRQAARLLRMSLTSNITDALPLVQAPALVIYPRDLRLVPLKRCVSSPTSSRAPSCA